MPFGQTIALGAIAGFTIFLGLPVGRLRRVSTRARVGLSMFSAGILAFIFMDVGSHAMEIVDAHLTAFKDHRSSFWPVAGLFALMGLGFLAGVGGIATVQRRLAPTSASVPPLAGGEATAALSEVERSRQRRGASDAERRALRTGMTIAAAIGLHNLGEGLAIGVSAQSGEIGLATVLIVGFALHNATEGLGIVGPLGAIRPSWRWLAVAGLVGGVPTFLGTVIGYQVTSDALELLFYALAGGAILYVIGEIWAGVRRQGHPELGLYLLGAGFLAGVATDLVVAYGGG
ncbi:MAG: ZIP family metal transporter [Solirubrobacteraceae bacterium]